MNRITTTPGVGDVGITGDDIDHPATSRTKGTVRRGPMEQAYGVVNGASASGCCPEHQYAADGDYTVTLTVTTTDGRTDSASQIVPVRTHDVAVVSVDVPKTASVGSTRTVTVRVASGKYTENVRVYLLRSVPGGFDTVDVQTQTIPAGTTVAFRFAYTFTSSDASFGTIAFQAQAGVTDHIDPIPVDNFLTSANVRVVGRR